ncbi:UNVERIFIED_ORG: GntR family transcriptional regulator/MocR family aminotransferase [Pseudomonas parafulva]|jgi:GntR family transcriptional regulator/MocR family aminotransferase|uniref:MocR-like pyridoxine biosynthesis transcription factor PdxR n=1 Tax=Pseudomonas TaxID=286 RepID=UPI0003C5BFAD|nr:MULTISPECIES: PLP-dependent aminotransferase family protein [Pseudomonas]MDP9558746.1 GntR family transcriptional regulator/MocR family aminotransferase [Pseudomonas parafulva]MDP9664189.1 GntR family transcriptional regulator/MocR family aminotransferase [Pseudomonas cremoricolorata]HCP31431.1 PLP-dependent aminotransferase family protein [Pseudomonas sp.]AVF54228.1 PLP-dependent aminotransferase family protein [Pseudomonas fulva]EST16968.1 aminotransferase class I and II family protein [P
MAKTFALDTLKIRLNDAEFQLLDLHQRIQRALRALILDGALGPSLKLPSTRALSKSLGCARDTVENAYVQLHRDGFIVRRGGAGSYVCDTVGAELRGAGPRRQRTQEVRRSVVAPGAELSQRGRMIFETGGVRDQQVIKAFATGLPETRSFPTDVWERLQRQVVKDYRASVLLHGDPQGAEPLRKAIATYLNLERGATCTPDQVLVLSSTRQALYLCAQLLVDAGKPILLENPGYYGARKAFAIAETKVLPIDVDERGIRTDLLFADRSGANCVYVTPSHQYPTGATLPLERRLELINWAAQKAKWIIEDDYDSEFHYDGQPTACVQGLDRYQRTLYIGTFSKTLYPGLRMGYIVLPPELVKPFAYARSMMDGHTPQTLQLTLARFMEDGHYNAHVRAMRKLYAGRRAVMHDAIAKYLSPVVTAHLPPGGLQIPCLLKPGWSEEKTIRQAATAGVQLSGLSSLYLGEPQTHGWLLGYSSLTAYEIEAAMLRLANALKL